MRSLPHQYVSRETGQICTERLYHNSLIRLLYSRDNERSGVVFRALTSRHLSRFLGFINYDVALGSRLTGNQRFLRELGVDLSECLDAPETLDTARKVFERKIRYWECRPLADDLHAVVSPADARVLVGTLNDTSDLFLKEKFFRYDELLGGSARPWHRAFLGGDFAIFRLTPDKYHYNHSPVSGRVLDCFELDGAYHPCNPNAVVTAVTPYSKNKRVVTVIDTDVPEGTGVGLVGMVEIAALMVGDIVQCYSDRRYDDPRPVAPGLFLRKGSPKSLFRPGGSTDVLLFQPQRVTFAADITANMHTNAESRFCDRFASPLVETDVRVRSLIAAARTRNERESA